MKLGVLIELSRPPVAVYFFPKISVLDLEVHRIREELGFPAKRILYKNATLDRATQGHRYTASVQKVTWQK